MSRTIDQRVVEMKFDNKNFEKNVSETMSTLDKLKQKLNLTGASKGLENIDTQARKMDFSVLSRAAETVGSKFSALEVMGITALANITNSAVNAGKKIVSALTIEPIKTGFNEYETKINAIQTIMSNTSSKGTTMDDVTRVLNELNTYADKTIYNFAEMTRNIGTFTAAGVGLEESASAIQGIANLAAASGSSSQQASTAMYQLSQALAAGSVKLQDWNSVVNAGMGGEKFQEALKATAREHGVNVDQMIKDSGSFRESLKEGWISAEILNETLSKFTVEGAKKYATSMIESGKWTQEQADALIKEAQAMEDAATKVKTFTQLWDTLKESVQSGWSQSWEIVIGNFEEAKDFLTEVSDTIGKVIGDSADARNKVLQDWKDLGGRTAIIDSLRNSFNSIANIITPISQAFREIFPPITGKQLFSFSEGLKNLTARFEEITKKYGPKIKSTFKGIFAVLDIGVTFIKDIVGGIVDLVGSFIGVSGGILGATAALGDWISGVRDSIKESNIFGKAINGIVGFLIKGIDKIKEFTKSVRDKIGFSGFEGFLAILKGIWDFVSKIGKKIGEVFDNALRSGGIKAGFDVLNAGLFSGILVGINKFIKNLGGAFDEAKGFIGNLKDTLGELKGILEAYQQDLKAKTLVKIATAIGILAASIAVLAFIKPERLSQAVAALTMLFVELMGSLVVFGKIAPNVTKVGKAAAAIITISSALLILSLAMKIMSTMDWKEMGVGLITTVVGLGALVGSTRLLPKEAELKGATSAIKKLAGALVVLAVAMKIMGSMSWTEMAVGLSTMTIALGELIGLMWALPKNSGGKTDGVVKLAFSLVILGGALKILATMTWDEIGRSMAVMAGALGQFIGFAWALHATNFSGNTSGMFKMATSLVVLGGALKILASMSWPEIARSLTVMGIALAELIGFTWALHKADTFGTTSVSMLAMSSSLVILAGALKMIGSMDFWALVQGLGGIATALIVFGVAAKLLAPLAPTLLSLAGAFALFGVATVGIGSGLLLISAGITALGVALASGTTAIVAGLSAIILGILGMVPDILKIIKEIIVGVCDVIIEAAPKIVETLWILSSKLWEGLAKYSPMIVESLMDFLIGVFTAIRDKLPELIVVAMEVIGAFFKGIVDALNGMNTSNLLKGIAGLGLLTGLMYLLAGIASLVPGAMLGVLGMGVLIAELALVLAAIGGLAQVPGLSWFIEEGGNLLQKIGTAIGQFVGGIVGGIAEGATSKLPKVGTNLANFMKNLQPFIDGVKKIDEKALVGIASLSAAILTLTAANLIEGVTSFLSGGSSFADLGYELSAFMSNASGFISASSKIDPTIMSGVKTLAEAILLLTSAELLQGITSWITGGSSLADFGAELSGLGTHLNQFADELGSFDESKVTTIDCAGRAIKALATAASELPNEGGLWGALVGENSLATFGGYLPGLGTNLKGFVDNLGTFDDSKLATVDCAGRAIKALAESASEIPNEGGLWGLIVGDNGLSKFANNLPGLGTHLSQFMSNLGTFDESKVTTIDCAGKAIKTLASAASEIPNEGGLWAKIAGDNSLATFSKNLPGLAKNIAAFVKNLGTFTGAQVTTINSACNAIRSIAKLGEINIKNTGKGLNSFGENMVDFAGKVKSFVDKIGKVSGKGIDSAINKTKELITMATSIASIDIKSLSTFGDSLKKVASDGVKGFVKEFSGEEPKKEATAAIEEMIDATIEGAEGKKSSVKKKFESIAEAAVDALCTTSLLYDAGQAGKDLVAGFVNGIRNNQSSVISAGSALGRLALDAARRAIDSHSPSKEAMKIGNFFGEGLVIGIHDYETDTYNAGYDIADNAKKGLSRAFSRISDLINGDMDMQPTIRPILDLSDVKDGANYLNTMLNDGSSIGVASNLNAISSGINARLQNGTNDDVVSAINKLRQDLGNVGGNTYNVNGVTYDDGSNISAAVRDLIRAAKVERRI